MADRYIKEYKEYSGPLWVSPLHQVVRKRLFYPLSDERKYSYGQYVDPQDPLIARSFIHNSDATTFAEGFTPGNAISAQRPIKINMKT